MSSEEPGWELYRSFLAVMREGSLSAAARALGMTQPSLGRHVRRLEAMLGVALFTRSPQGLTPTDLGHELVPHAQAMAAASAALRRAASAGQREVRGTVRLTCSEVIGVEVLPPMLASFREAYPGVVIELSLSDRNEDLLRKDADIAIRMQRPAQAALVARRIGTIPLGLFARRSYLRRHGVPRTLDALSQHALIGFDHEAPAQRMVVERLGLERGDFTLRCDSGLAQLAAIRAGIGIGVCQRAIAQRDRQLAAVLAGEFSFAMETWLVMHEDLRASRRTRLLFDHLAQAMGGYVASA